MIMMNSTSASPQSLRTRQINALKQLINLNQPVSGSLAVEPVWKVLIFDKYGQDIISPLLTVKDLRELGVTLHLLADSIREPLPDVPAVYFVLPTETNVRIICEDLASGLYESYLLNFISALNRPRLEDLAAAAVQNNCIAQVQRVFDQYLNFISLEDNLFTLRRHIDSNPLSFYAINRRDMSEVLMGEILESVADGLFSVCVTIGVVPIIRCPRGNAAEQVAERLDKKLRENLRDTRNNLFTNENVRVGQLNFQRPLLLVTDRGLDLATLLHHTWTYQALVHDVLDLDLNRVEIHDKPGSPAADGRSRGKTKEYDLNVSDKFWMAQKGSPFPSVAEAVQEELESYRASEEEIKRLKNQMGLEAESEEAISMLSDTTQKLTSTVSSLPELLEKKRLIDMHTNVATAVLQHVKERKLDVYFETEEKLMNLQSGERTILDILKDPNCGSVDDKIRLLLIHFICNDVSDGELSQLILAMEACGADTTALKFVKLWKSIRIMPSDDLAGGGTKTVSMFSKLLNQSSQLVMEGVKNLVIKRHNLPLTAALDALMEQKPSPNVDDYRYFDPKLLRQTSDSTPRNRSAFHEAVVFVVGGGNYVEYQNLMDYVKAKSVHTPRRVTYGATELVNASQFLAQLTRLGSEM